MKIIDTYLNGNLSQAREEFWKMSKEAQADTLQQAWFVSDGMKKTLDLGHFIRTIFQS